MSHGAVSEYLHLCERIKRMKYVCWGFSGDIRSYPFEILYQGHTQGEICRERVSDGRVEERRDRGRGQKGVRWERGTGTTLPIRQHVQAHDS